MVFGRLGVEGVDLFVSIEDLVEVGEYEFGAVLVCIL